MDKFLTHLDRDLFQCSFTITTTNDVTTLYHRVIIHIIIILKRAFQVNIYDLFLCDSPQHQSPHQLLKNINQKIIKDFINDRKTILNDLYPDLQFPPNFWSYIYMDFEFGNIYYRVIMHYFTWINNQLKHKQYIISLLSGYTESLLWSYLILSSSGFNIIHNQLSHNILIASILCIIYAFHLFALQYTLHNCFNLFPIFKTFEAFLQQHFEFNMSYTWILSVPIQKWCCLSYPIDIQININNLTQHYYLPYFILNDGTIVPLRNKYILFMCFFKYIFGLIISLLLLNNYSNLFYLYSLVNIVLFCVFIVIVMMLFGVIMITNYQIPPVTALTIILMTMSCSLLFYGIIIIILYFADRRLLEETATDDSGWLSSIFVPVLFFICWSMTVYKIYKNYKRYHQWTWVLVNLLCVYQIFTLLNHNIAACAAFMLLMCAMYIEFQHRLHHAFTALKYQHFVNKYVHNRWNKECLCNLLFGQAYVVFERESVQIDPQFVNC